MDDYDLTGNIEQHADEAEGHLSSETRFRNDDAHLEPTRWWFASSAFPMIAGTLGPVASAFSICALVRPWRQQLPAGANVQLAEFIPDPAWLTIVNAIQLAVAIVANVFLLLNMTRRVRFSIAQPITMVGWYVSAICLMVLLTMSAGPLQQGLKFPLSELIWSQAFYYGIWATILYFIDASLMVVTFWGASMGRYPKEFVLSASQRTLMLQTIMFLGYLLVGALVFSTTEGWNYLDAVYWADVTLFTVGFGDYTVASTVGRALLFPYALVGIISLGLVIGSIRSMILERGRRRVEARLQEKARRKTIRTMTLKGNEDFLKPMTESSDTSPNTQTNDKHPTTEYERRKGEFELMRKIQLRANNRRKWMAMFVSFTTWVVLWTIGALIFLEAEKPYQPWWTYFDSFYLCFVTLTTIGYGDITPISNPGKSFFVFWSLLALPTMTVLISNAGDTVVKFVRDATLRLGNLTILPGDEGFSRDMKYVAHKLTFGKVFPDFIEGVPVTSNHFRGRATQPRAESFSQPQDDDRDDNNDDDDDDRGRSNINLALGQGIGTIRRASRAPSTFTTKVRRSLSRLRDPLDSLPTGNDFHFLLISEIQAVSKHLNAKPARQYSFDEWAWYLKLIGEDERDAEMHRMAKPYVRKSKRTSETRPEDELTKWSWVGVRSPLMGSQEESEWILEKLTDRLKESLSAEGHRRTKVKKPEAPPNPMHQC